MGSGELALRDLSLMAEIQFPFSLGLCILGPHSLRGETDQSAGSGNQNTNSHLWELTMCHGRLRAVPAPSHLKIAPTLPFSENTEAQSGG